MDKGFHYVLQILGLLGALFFCVNATASISGVPQVSASIAEPLNLLFAGFGLIGIGSFIKKYSDQ